MNLRSQGPSPAAAGRLHLLWVRTARSGQWWFWAGIPRGHTRAHTHTHTTLPSKCPLTLGPSSLSLPLPGHLPVLTPRDPSDLWSFPSDWHSDLLPCSPATPTCSLLVDHACMHVRAHTQNREHVHAENRNSLVRRLTGWLAREPSRPAALFTCDQQILSPFSLYFLVYFSLDNFGPSLSPPLVLCLIIIFTNFHNSLKISYNKFYTLPKFSCPCIQQ